MNRPIPLKEGFISHISPREESKREQQGNHQAKVRRQEQK
jgi:hypothetical protein